MGQFVALYRGINVVGRNSVKMELLRAVHARLGHRDVKSYIQSGNVLFSARGAAATIAKGISREFAEEFGFAARVMVLPAERLGTIVRANPYGGFSATLPHTVHAGVCEGDPSVEKLKELLAKTGTTERVEIRAGVIYLHAPDGFGPSKFAAGMERASGVPVTVRNWRTIETLWNMLQSGSGPAERPARRALRRKA